MTKLRVAVGQARRVHNLSTMLRPLPVIIENFSSRKHARNVRQFRSFPKCGVPNRNQRPTVSFNDVIGGGGGGGDRRYYCNGFGARELYNARNR